jgi:hypothetical protein
MSANPGAATIVLTLNGATSYTISSDSFIPNIAVVGGNYNNGTEFQLEIEGPAQTVGGVCCASNPSGFVALVYSGASLPQLPKTLTGVNFTSGILGWSQFTPPFPNAALVGPIAISSIAPLPSPIPAPPGDTNWCDLSKIFCDVVGGLIIAASIYVCVQSGGTGCIAAAAATALSPVGPVATTATAPSGILVQAVSGGTLQTVGMPPASVVPNPTNYIIRAGSTIASVAPGGQFKFPQNVSRFTITGIDFSLLSANGFPVSFTFVEDGNPVSIQATRGGIYGAVLL